MKVENNIVRIIFHRKVFKVSKFKSKYLWLEIIIILVLVKVIKVKIVQNFRIKYRLKKIIGKIKKEVLRLL